MWLFYVEKIVTRGTGEPGLEEGRGDARRRRKKNNIEVTKDSILGRTNEKYKRGEPVFGNFETVANDNWNKIMKPVTEYMITSGDIEELIYVQI